MTEIHTINDGFKIDPHMVLQQLSHTFLITARYCHTYVTEIPKLAFGSSIQF